MFPKFPKFFKLSNLSFLISHFSFLSFHLSPFTFHFSSLLFALCSNLPNLPFALPAIFTGTIFRTREAIGKKFYF